MKNLLLMMLTALCMCCSDDDSCDWELIEPSVINDSINEEMLNIIFSEQNVRLKDLDDTLLVIRTRQDLENIYDIDDEVGIDFENYVLIGAKFKTSSISNSISKVNLNRCDMDSSHRLEVEVEQCTECFTAIGDLYFWRIYPSIDSQNSIDFVIK